MSNYISEGALDETKPLSCFPSVILDVNRINIHSETSFILRTLARIDQFCYQSGSHAVSVKQVVVSSVLLMYHEKEKCGVGTKGSLLVGGLANSML